MTTEDFKKKLGLKIRGLRESMNWSQQGLAEKLQWSSHVIVGNVEAGTRDIKAWELAELSKHFKISMHSLLSIDNTPSPTESKFILWREKPHGAVVKEQEAKFFEICDRYTFLEKALYGSVPKKVQRNLPTFSLDLRSTNFSEIYDLAEQTRRELDLGSYPSDDLIRSLEDDYNVRIVYLNLSEDGSAACSVMGPDKFIMLNANEVPWRRNFSLAHELFHLITWNAELFAQIESDAQLQQKNESFANAFAAGLLMPQEQTRHLISECSNNGNEISCNDLLAIARDFQVSTDALLRRLVNLNIVSQKSRDSPAASSLISSAQESLSQSAVEAHLLFLSRKFR